MKPTYIYAIGVLWLATGIAGVNTIWDGVIALGVGAVLYSVVAILEDL